MPKNLSPPEQSVFADRIVHPSILVVIAFANGEGRARK